jgi:hypothetical protein
MAKRITDKMRSKHEKMNQKRRHKAKVRKSNKALPQVATPDTYCAPIRQRDSLHVAAPDGVLIASINFKEMPQIPGWVPEITKFRREVS